VRLRVYARLYRVRHWVKNLLVFAPPFFAGVFEPGGLFRAFLAFLAFSLVSSAVYVINDLADRRLDRLHPEKRQRPIASGEVKPEEALLHAAFLALSGLLFGFAAGVAAVTLLYLLLNLLYSFWAKNLPLLDVLIVSSGFLLRLWAGAEASAVPLSDWILLITFHLALFIALAKRYEDARLLKKGILTRKVLKFYDERFLYSAVLFTASITVTLYAIFTVVEHSGSKLYLTTPLVVLGFLRYFWAVFYGKMGGNPVALIFKDRFLQLVVLLWLACYHLLRA